MKEIGTVVGVKDGKISVSVKRTAACERCGKCRHAHIAFGDNSTLTIEAIPVSQVKIGDLVELEMTGQDYLWLSFLVYMLPLLGTGAGFAVGWLLGRALGNANLWGGIFAAGALALSFFWLHQYDKSAGKTGRFLPLARPVEDSDLQT